MADKDDLSDALEDFKLCDEAETHNRTDALDDLRFAKLGEQWPDEIKKKRKGKPTLTLNRMPSFIRQVVNDARQNKPSIKVHPADSFADPQTAEIYNGLIRNIEVTSSADVAYDTAFDFAVTMGFGYFRIDTEYACDDTFDLDIRINRIINPFSVYGDYLSVAADSSDWNRCFVTELIGYKDFERKYKGADKVNWNDSGYAGLDSPWVQDKSVLVAEYWTREKVKKPIVALSDGSVVSLEVYKTQRIGFDQSGVTVIGSRDVQSHQVRQRIMTGAEVLEDNKWAGKYIPIVPVYGDEVNVEGKRYFRSLIRDAKDSQRQYNYWRTASTELVALAPKVPYIGPKGAFDTDGHKWATVNQESHSHIEYDGAVAPERQMIGGAQTAGAIQEALGASDDMKAIVGIYDASLGARSNETSGRAIMARQREGDVSTFHFIDNLSRAIEHGGRIVVDLIPTVYTGERMIRVLGQDGTPNTVQLAQAQNGQPIPQGVYDLSRGKYDLTVETGPSFSTRREEAAVQMTEFVRAYPDAAPLVGDLLVKNLDWPGADEIAERLKVVAQKMLGGGQGDPQAANEAAQLAQENQQLKAQLAAAKQDSLNKSEELKIKAFEAETDRMKVGIEAARPKSLPANNVQ